MGVIQDEVDEWTEDLPRQLATEFIKRKLKEYNINLPKMALDDLVARLTAGEENVQIDAGSGHTNITIVFTDEDFAWFDKRSDELLEKIPAMIDEASEGFSATILAGLKKKWRGEWRQQQCEMKGFRDRLHARWGAGLERIRMLITIAREFGDAFNQEGGAAGGGPNPYSYDVLRRLHARACQVADEVICLLSNGFADGAMARWRTMHEIAAVAYLIDQHGDSLAERYIMHQIVEARSGAIQYRKHQVRLGQEPISDDEYNEIEANYQAALQRYGESFGGQYGWAAEHINRQRPTIADIQAAANIDHLGPYYKMASHNVHANPKGVFFKLGLIGETEALLAGPSNAGLTDPGHATALSLMQISSVLMKANLTADNIVTLKIMQRLSDEIGAALLSAQKQLSEDERLLSDEQIPPSSNESDTETQ